MRTVLPKSVIYDRGRGAEIKGTRITVYDILDHYLEGRHHTWIAAFYRLSSDQVLSAIDYIEENKAEVMDEYEKMLAREQEGNPPEIRAALAKSHQKLMVLARRAREKKKSGRSSNARATGGH